MALSVCNWYEAGALLRKIRETCDAFIRGDQPEKTDHLEVDDIKELFDVASGIVEFCIASIARRASGLEFRDRETYHYARTYARNLASVLLHHEGSDPRDHFIYEEWLEGEPDRPDLLQYI